MLEPNLWMANAPGSVLFLVWGQGRTELLPTGAFDAWDDARGLFAAPATNTLLIKAVLSAMPSTRPSVSVLAPRVVTRNTGNSEWMSSDEKSMHRLTKPSSQTTRGRRLFMSCCAAQARKGKGEHLDLSGRRNQSARCSFRGVAYGCGTTAQHFQHD